MGRPSMSEDAVKANKISIISAAMEMIREDGLNSVAARPLGTKVGMNSALIYRYFKDIDEVILFACVHVLQEYSEEMLRANDMLESGAGNGDVDDEKIYLMSWELFCKHAFNNPEEYNRLFFSRHSSELESVIKEYYRLFPPERNDDRDIILDAMFRSSKLKSRNLMLLIPILEGMLTQNEIILINDLTVSYFYSLLLQLVDNEYDVTPENQTKRMLDACKYLTGL